VIVKFSPRARRRVTLVSSWWRSNRRAASMLFDEELEHAIQQLETQPTLGAVYQSVEDEVVRRLLLPKTQQHVYYVIDEALRAVVIYTIWGARRGTRGEWPDQNVACPHRSLALGGQAKSPSRIWPAAS
jgi:plasmid stabilization system protein ParE